MKPFFKILILAVCPVFVTSCTQVTLNVNPKRVLWNSEGHLLSGGKPEGGTYYGDGVRNNCFYPNETKPSDCSYSYKVKIKYRKGIFSHVAEDFVRVEGYYDEPPKCPKCDGTGEMECPVCHKDRKKIKYTKCQATGCNGGNLTDKCVRCSGTGMEAGRIWGKNKCSVCNGIGNVKRQCIHCGGTGHVPCCPDGKGIVDCDKCCSKD